MENKISLLPLLARGVTGTKKRECPGRGFEAEHGSDALGPMQCAIDHGRVQNDLKKPLQ